jgi:hypothetical protein
MGIVPDKRTNRQNREFWGLVKQLTKALGDRAEAEGIARDVVEEITGQRSTSRMDRCQADRVIRELRQRVEPVSLRFNELERRPGMATPKQLRMLEALAVDALRGDSVEERRLRLRGFLMRQAGVNDLRFLESDQVTAVKRGLEEIRDRKAV